MYGDYDNQVHQPSPRETRQLKRAWVAIQCVDECDDEHIHSPKRVKRSGNFQSCCRHAAPTEQEVKPIHDIRRDEEYRSRVLQDLKLPGQSKPTPDDAETYGELANTLVREVLDRAQPPETTIGSTVAVEAYYMSPSQAAAMIDSPNYDPDIPIVTSAQQPFLQQTRPIRQFFDWLEDLDRLVSVNLPNRSIGSQQSAEHRRLAEVRDRFLNPQGTDDKQPWNILNLANPVPSTLPKFLQDINCQLLHRLRDAVLNGGRTADRVSAKLAKWNEWCDVLEWALLAEGGHMTAPHTDSHGFDTWISVQEGDFGFGWMARPTRLERERWMSDPQGCTQEENWRYVVLRPGQTVFFGSGTIHFVFRARGVQTLAFGGHVLRWSGLERWLSVVIDQVRYPDTTNEWMVETIRNYVATVERLVAQRNKYRVGEDIGLARFQNLIKEFEKVHKERVKSLKPSPKTKVRSRRATTSKSPTPGL
ncbi:hypothetical protein B0H66DRAFT_607279 [Apodospora peruviana]|uniref:JmjC domain-containing protein n=1 Tax=Apodospora peruviana TaxID=516989 RepID=A0AAE0LZV5_9PEZI|nr:hypothetical protein B0H66DRAFT_607279 [Apodospora peruviana]